MHTHVHIPTFHGFVSLSEGQQGVEQVIKVHIFTVQNITTILENCTVHHIYTQKTHLWSKRSVSFKYFLKDTLNCAFSFLAVISGSQSPWPGVFLGCG